MGTIALENPRPISVKRFTKEGESRGPLYEFFPQRYASSYEHLLDDFVSKARSDEPFTVTIQDGLRSLTLAEAARRSAEAHLPVSISAIS
jgi:myo-inositol 2-dehydrogenase / D-chiro-inositol 1-dehydrogenase